jgi:hypothetical protein
LEAVMLNRRAFLRDALLFALVPRVGQAQQGRKVARIGLLQPGSRPPAWVASFREGLRELGYIEGQSVVIEHRLAGAISEQSTLAAELAGLNVVDVIFTWSTPAALAVKRATSTIPVVAITGNPVDLGLAASLGQPGGNVAGFAVLDDQLELKRLQLRKEGFPRVSRMAVVWNPANPIWSPLVERLQDSAPTLGVSVYSVAAQSPGEGRGRRRHEVSASRDLLADRVRQHGGTDGVLARLSGHVPAGRVPCRQDSQGCEARRSPYRATDQVRARDQSEDRADPRSHPPAVAAAAGGPGDRVSILDYPVQP